MSKQNPGVIFDASNSWNGYNHQGKLAVLLSIIKILELYDENRSIDENKDLLKDYFLEIEHLEDFAIGQEINGHPVYESIHQVKNHASDAPSHYDSAILGLLSHVNQKKSIQNAYLHLTTKVEFNDLANYISELIDNPKELNKSIGEINAIRNNPGKKAEVLAKKGSRASIIAKLKTALINEYPSEGGLNAKNIDLACDLLEKNINSQKNELGNISAIDLNKISIYQYDINGTIMEYCPVDCIKGLLLNAIEKTVDKMILQPIWKESQKLEWRYEYILGKMDEHIIERNLNYPMYKDETLDRKIKFPVIIDWITNRDIDESEELFYKYHIKNQYYDSIDQYCQRICDNNVCDECHIISAKNHLAKMSIDEMKEFVTLASPDIVEELSLRSFPRYANDMKIKNPILKGIRKTSNPFDPEKEAFTYKDEDTSQYVLTTIRHDEDAKNDEASICSDIVSNKRIYELLMDCNYFVSKDIDVESISDEALKIGKTMIDNDNSLSAEHIAKIRKVGLISINNFLDVFKEK